MNADTANLKAPRSAPERVLFHLKMYGDQTSADIGKALGTSGEAARQQLVRLAEEGMVEPWSKASGVGRPSQFWRLTDQARSHFPDTHAHLTVELLSTIKSLLGDDALDRLISARETSTKETYAQRLIHTTTLLEKLEALAHLRSDEGYMSYVESDGESGYFLHENHCPICAAATMCQNFCRSELEVFQEVLGSNAKIVRTSHIVSGARRCSYHVTPIIQ